MISDIWKTMRPTHWLKNLFVFAPLFFSGSATHPDKVAVVVVVFLCFSLMSSAVYLLNDIMDRERDLNHPGKCLRPLASGRLSVRFAAMFAGLLALTSLSAASAVSKPLTGILAAYGLLNVTYSVWLKHVVIADVFCIAIGFVLRVTAGGLVIDVDRSSWLIVATFLLALFLGLGKRRSELLLLEESSSAHRPILEEYSPKLVDELISVVTPVTLVTYLLYTLDPETIAKFGSKALYYTGFFVVFGIFRYLYLIHQKDLGGSPTELVVRDLPLAAAIVGWTVSFSLIVYLK